LLLTIAGVTAALLIYSQTAAFAWDEGFHLLAAQLISHGKKPYADFLFAQAPLNAYWNALWLSLFGATWRPAQAVAALESAGGMTLAATFVLRRFPDAAWRSRLAVTTAALVGLNIVVVEYGTLAQAYGLCLLLTVSAFRLTVAAADRKDSRLAGLAGLASGAAAASSLLTAPIGPVLLVWLFLRVRRARTAVAFLAGTLMGLSPLLIAFLRWPKQAFFDTIGFHVHYRQVQWDDWLPHDIGIVTDWLNCAQAFILIGLAVAGVWFLRGSEWDGTRRSGFYLSAWIAGVEGLYLATAHPTFAQYFILTVPFTAILASAGVYAATREWNPRGACAAIVLLTAAGAVRSVYDQRDFNTWATFDEIVPAVNRVTPAGAPLFADEQVYFLTGRAPPAGLEWMSGHKIEMPMDQARPLHAMPQSEVDREVRQGAFSTFETCEEGEIDRLGLRKMYAREKVSNDCHVFWDRRR